MEIAFNRQAVKRIVSGVTSHIQEEKVYGASIPNIQKLQRAELFPEEYVAYHTSTNKKNLFAEPDKFFSWMLKSNKLWNRKFIFIAGEEDLSERIREAALFAVRTARQQYGKYGVNRTGFLANQLHTMLDGNVIRDPVAGIRAINSDSIFSVVNTAAYAATSEVNALYINKMGGLMLYTARQVQNRYPDLGVMFMYNRADEILKAGLRITDSKGKPYLYDTPVLHIGSIANVSGPWSQPGHRRRGRIKAVRAAERRKRNAARRVQRINESFGA